MPSYSQQNPRVHNRRRCLITQAFPALATLGPRPARVLLEGGGCAAHASTSQRPALPYQGRALLGTLPSMALDFLLQNAYWKGRVRRGQPMSPCRVRRGGWGHPDTWSVTSNCPPASSPLSRFSAERFSATLRALIQMDPLSPNPVVS